MESQPVSLKILNSGIILKTFNVHSTRGVEIINFSSCPGTSKKPKCTCP